MGDLGLLNVAECFIYSFVVLSGLINYELKLDQLSSASCVSQVYEIELEDEIITHFGVKIYFRKDNISNTFVYYLELTNISAWDDIEFTIIVDYPLCVISQDETYILQFTTTEYIEKVRFKIVLLQ